jgi:hypothetical protein
VCAGQQAVIFKVRLGLGETETYKQRDIREETEQTIKIPSKTG